MFTFPITFISAVDAIFQTKAVDLDWSTEYLANTTSQAIWITNSWTLNIWLKFTALTTDRVFFQIYNYPTDANNSIDFKMTTTWYYVIVRDSSWTAQKQYTTSQIFSTWTQYMISVTWDWTTLTLHQNATVDTTPTKNIDNACTQTATNRRVFLWNNVWVNNYSNIINSIAQIWDTNLATNELVSLYDSWNGYQLDARNAVWSYTSTWNLKHQWALWKNTWINIWEDFVSSWNINISDNSVNVTDADIVLF